MKFFSAIVLAATVATAAPAQQALIVGAPAGPVLRAGTEVPLRTLEELTTKGKHLREGYRFELETTEPVMLQGHVVIPVGTHAIGEVTSVRNKGMLGRSGQIETRLLYLRAGDRQIRLSGVSNDKGVAGTAGVVGTALVVWPVAFFVTGTSARIPSGAPVKGFIDEDVPVAFADGAAPAPLMVAASPAAASAQPASGGSATAAPKR